MKKAQGMSINVIILIVLGLIVLIILTFVIGGKFTDFGSTISQCDGTCVATIADCKDIGAPIPMNNCKEGNTNIRDGNSYCCKRV